ncbi:MAG: ceramidase domain-containing protein [Acidimicrobiia bacterium]|nr:ceramidase domain-containing protein [Acidimicrobiia bacterium]
MSAVAAFFLVFLAFGANGWGPPASNESAIGEISRWCERVSSGLLREPVNTLGNLGFVIAGLLMFAILARDELAGRPRRNPFIGNTPTAVLYASATLFLGPGSMAMHGTHTPFGAWLDNVSMVAFILIPWLHNTAVLGRWRRSGFFTAYALLLAAYAAGYWFLGPDLGIGLDLFGLSIGLWIVSEVVFRYWSPPVRFLSGFVGFVVAFAFGVTPADMAAEPERYWWVILFWLPGLLATSPAPVRRRYVPWFWVGMGSFLAAYAIWLTGTADHPACDPDSLIQAHAIWHLLSAVATLSFFWFLRTGRAIQSESSSPSATSGSFPS